jgi:hypothetical protein
MKARFIWKLLMVLVVAAVLGGAVMVLWNLVMPGLFAGILQIDYWHALGLLVLSRILFGGFRGHGGWHGRRQWQKWQAMTAEEREQFRKGRSAPCKKNEE